MRLKRFLNCFELILGLKLIIEPYYISGRYLMSVIMHIQINRYHNNLLRIKYPIKKIFFITRQDSRYYVSKIFSTMIL